MTSADLLAAKRKGHTYAVVFNTVRLNQPTTFKLISTHKTFAEACRAMRNKGNAVYPLDELLRTLK